MSVSYWLLQQKKVGASSVVEKFIDDGKLANQIARLQAIVVKMSFPANLGITAVFRSTYEYLQSDV